MDDWKEKYYSSLELLEDKEKEWSEADQLLRRCISRITLSADGKNKKLDEQLDRLRNSVRRERNYERIRNMVDIIVETATDKSVKTISARALTNKLIDKLPFPNKLNKKKRAIKKRLDYLKDESGIVDIFESVLDLIEQSIKTEIPAGEKKDKEAKGIFGGMFSGGKKSEEKTSEPIAAAAENIPPQIPTAIDKPLGVEDVIDIIRKVLVDLLMAVDVPVPVAADLDTLREKTRRIETKKDLQTLVKDIASLVSTGTTISFNEKKDLEITDDISTPALSINEILIQLLERLDLPEELADIAATLKEEWASGIDEDDVVSALESIADLVIKMRTRIEHEKNDFQEFLKQVTEKLQMLDQHIQDNAEDQKSIFDENKKFSADVDGEVEKIQSDVTEAIDLNDLKTSIAMKLSKITKHVETFRTTEEERKLQMEIRVGELASKVHQLETESKGLQERLVEEQKNAMQDALTKLPNRLAWNQRMEYEFSRWSRYQSPLVIVIWDIDDFKKVNDTYGHKAGDKVLTTIATLLKDRIRDTDFIARFGGEEFVMLLPETEIAQAQAVVEKLRVAIEECEFHHGDRNVVITVSGGMTQFKKGDTSETAFERADQFLYKAKGSGKNRCNSELD